MFSKFLTTDKNSQTCTPYIYNLNYSIHKTELEKLLQSTSGVLVYDEIESQLKELIKLKHPKRKLTDAETKELMKLHLGEQSLQNYGVWVFYPWLNKVIHLLAEDEFVEVRTNRNHYKITPEEEKILATKGHVPSFIAKWMYAKLDEMKQNDDLTQEEFLSMDTNLKTFSDIIGACERIKNTPLPFSYSNFLKKFIQ